MFFHVFQSHTWHKNLNCLRLGSAQKGTKDSSTAFKNLFNWLYVLRHLGSAYSPVPEFKRGKKWLDETFKTKIFLETKHITGKTSRK